MAWRLATAWTGGRRRARDRVRLPRRDPGDHRRLPGGVGRRLPPAHVEMFDPLDPYRDAPMPATRRPTICSARPSVCGAGPAARGRVRRRRVHDRRDLRAAAGVRAARSRERTHEVGALYVADEVQAGHGRTGDGLWSLRGAAGAGRHRHARQADGQRPPGRRGDHAPRADRASRRDDRVLLDVRRQPGRLRRGVRRARRDRGRAARRAGGGGRRRAPRRDRRAIGGARRSATCAGSVC